MSHRSKDVHVVQSQNHYVEFCPPIDLCDFVGEMQHAGLIVLDL